jgi:glycosyltransferase involved in cell wall biosynthesis
VADGSLMVPTMTAVVVLTYNRPAALLAVLRSLALQCGPQHEVWIADDGSTPDTLAQLKAELPQFSCSVRHVWHPDMGFTAARARNLAAERSDADYLIFLDGDCVPNKSFLREHARLSCSRSYINGSRVLLSDRISQAVVTQQADLVHAAWSQWLSWRLTSDCNKLLHATLRWHGPRPVTGHFVWKGIRSCNLSLWATDFRAVNGFDETFSGWGHEDADLVLRLHNQGCRRINGFLATEVFHLWHPEQKRDSEVSNRSRVLERLQLKQIRAVRGLEQISTEDTVVVTSLA